MSQSKALSSQGVHISVEAGASGTPVVATAVTAANPPVATKTAHGLNAGDVVACTLIGTPDWTSVNGEKFPIKPLTADTFSLLGADGSDETVATDGTFTPVGFANLCEAKTFQGFDGAASEIDVTTLCSTAKEVRLGLQDFGSFQFEMNLVPTDAAQMALDAAKSAGTPLWFKVDIPDGAGGMLGSFVFKAFVKSKSFSGGVDAVLVSSVSLRITGEPVYVAHL